LKSYRRLIVTILTVRHENFRPQARFRAFSVGDEPPPSDFPQKMPGPRAPQRIAPVRAVADTLTALYKLAILKS